MLDKRAIECYKSLKEGLGTHSPSQETVCQWVNDITNGWAETDNAPQCAAPTSAMDEHSVEQVKSVLEYTCNITSWQLLQNSESLQQVFTVSSPTFWGNKKFVQSEVSSLL